MSAGKLEILAHEDRAREHRNADKNGTRRREADGAVAEQPKGNERFTRPGFHEHGQEREQNRAHQHDDGLSRHPRILADPNPAAVDRQPQCALAQGHRDQRERDDRVEVLAARRRNATLRALDLDAAIDAFTSRGGELVSPVAQAAGGRRVHLKDRDGNLFECFEPGAA
ncbi:hypothetical protein QRX50_23425 [Amycolatopsis carbonis]|uniref:Uncharacterized protein n=1 Tax=Amycolatopsis carbonis TaxID=715471 RepID=A0A9Y2INR2_9PSEU|nr:hypothetical protein [Amycolatopsis sp. 2-15]WIX83497.1 hypothetical protein QRX50_23425 [Amycolatopsis sp. 2-15]